jgi:hypothetical protein
MRKFTKQEWETLAKRFNEKKMLGKLMLIKQNKDIFKLEQDNGWFMLRLHDQEAMENEYDMLFEFPNELSSRDIKDLFWMADITLY